MSARVRILNGTSTAQLDLRKSEDYLLQQGVRVTEVGKTKLSSRTTVILPIRPSSIPCGFSSNAFGITKGPQILIRPDPTETVDIEVRLGSDWVKKLPYGY